MMSEMLKGMITEEELLKLMALKPSELAYLRHEKGLPYVKLSTKRRVYLEEDLMDWFKSRRTSADLSQTSTFDSFKSSPTDTDKQPRTQKDAG